MAALAVIGSFLACGGDGPTASKQLLDLSRSTLTVAPAPYVSGQTYAATLAARDSKGDPYTRPATVAFSLSGGTSTGTFGAVANDGNGGYSTTFGALTAGTAATLSVSVDNVQIPVGARPQITVVPGPISLGQSSLAVGAPTLS